MVPGGPRSGRGVSFGGMDDPAVPAQIRTTDHSKGKIPLFAFALVVLVQLAFHLTASRYYTRIELQLLVTYLIVLFLMAQVFSQSSHWRGFVWFLMTLGFAISIFGILQHLTFNGKLYWFRVMRYGGLPFGPYVNRNHFAGFAEMVIPVALVPLVLGKVRRERVFWWGSLRWFRSLPCFCRHRAGESSASVCR